MSLLYKIAETKKFSKEISLPNAQPFHPKIKDVIYPQLQKNPFFGPNIKRLKGEMSGVYRYRIGNYRLFYTIDENDKTVFILHFVDRKEAYR